MAIRAGTRFAALSRVALAERSRSRNAAASPQGGWTESDIRLGEGQGRDDTATLDWPLNTGSRVGAKKRAAIRGETNDATER